MGVWRTSTNWNTLYSHISYIIMGPKCAALFFITMDTEGGGGGVVREHSREEEGNDLISPWEHANER